MAAALLFLACLFRQIEKHDQRAGWTTMALTSAINVGATRPELHLAVRLCRSLSGLAQEMGCARDRPQGHVSRHQRRLIINVADTLPVAVWWARRRAVLLLLFVAIMSKRHSDWNTVPVISWPSALAESARC